YLTASYSVLMAEPPFSRGVHLTPTSAAGSTARPNDPRSQRKRRTALCARSCGRAPGCDRPGRRLRCGAGDRVDATARGGAAFRSHVTPGGFFVGPEGDRDVRHGG